MADFVWSNEHTDVWFSPSLFKVRDRHKEHAKHLAILGADADTCHPDNFREYPDIVVESSPGRYQVYWQDIKGTVEEIAKVNRRIAQVHKAQGCDPSYVNPAKLMRVPGTSNSKHPGAIVTLIHDTPVVGERAAHLAFFIDLYPESEVADAYEASVGDMPDDLAEWIDQNRAKILNGMPNSQGLRDLIFKAPHPDARSEALFRLMCELYRLGLDDREVMAVAWGSPANKFNGEDPRGLKGLWDTGLLKAKTAAFDPDYEWDVSPDYFDGEEPAQRKRADSIQQYDFLTSEEHEELRGAVNFIDEWVTWAGTKTDAPAEYHRAAAMAVLSTVYSEFGHATPQWGPMKLNLWFMVLGRSTLDRKSTSRSYMNKAFRALKTEDGRYNYSLGDDVTPGGISLALHDRPNQASVFDRDEVQGLFKELLHQSYMSGGLEVFTKLYDGWSGGRVRASGDKKIQESVPVSFIMFMMGILTESADVLTVTNFRSGFLTRFLYVVGKRPDNYSPPPIEQSKEIEDKGDPVFDALIDHLDRNRAYWEMYGGDGDTVPIRATDEAWARYQKFEADVRKVASESLYSEVIATTSERTVHSTLKLAALLAMDDKSKRIEYHHMLQAIAYAGEWITNAVVMASMVSESEWQRDVDKLEQFINGKGGSVSYAVAYRHFQDKRPFEFEEMIAALEQRGVLIREKNGSRWTLKVSYGD